MGTKFSQMGPRWNPYWRTGIAHMGPTWVLGAKLYGAHMGMSIRDPYNRMQMMPIWDVPHFPHTLPTIFPDGPQVEPILANWDRPCGPHMGLGCKTLWGPYGHAHMGPIMQNTDAAHMGYLRFSPYHTHKVFPDGLQVEPILANWDRPYGPHMGLGCKILWDPYGRAHMGPIFEPRWDPHETHMGLLPGKCLLLTA